MNFLTPKKSAKKFVGIQMPSFYQKKSQIFLKREGFLVHSPSSAGPGVSPSSPMPWPARPPRDGPAGPFPLWLLPGEEAPLPCLFIQVCPPVLLDSG